MTAARTYWKSLCRRYERASTLLTSNRPVDDWGKLLATAPPLRLCSIRLLHHGHVLKIAVHGAGAQKTDCLLRRRRVKTTLSQTSSVGRF